MSSILRDLFGPGTWGTGGNLVAWVLCGFVGTTLALVFRKFIVRKLAGLWQKHAVNGWADEIASLRAHITAELEQHHAALHHRLDQHEILIRAAGTPDSPVSQPATSGDSPFPVAGPAGARRPRTTRKPSSES
jgi:hypothetical protein